MMQNYRFLLVASFFALLLLAGCVAPEVGAAEPAGAQQAAAQQILRQREDGVVLNPNSIEILQTQAFEDSTYVLLTYRRNRNGQDEACLMLMETHRELVKGWTSSGGSGSCSETELGVVKVTDPLHLSGGTQFRAGENKTDISHVIGRVNAPAIVKVRITWKDGQTQEAAVVKNSFMALRSGEVALKSAVGLSEQGEVVDTVQH